MAAQSGRRRRRPSDASGGARRPPRPARERGARRARARRGRGRDLPPRRRPGARPDGSPVTPRLASLVRKELDPARLAAGSRRRRLPLPPPADPRRGLRRPAQGHPRRPARALRRLAGSRHGEGLVELDELLGYHLEQAARYKAELGQADAALAERAAEHLAAAGRRALGRGDMRAAAPLLERALALTRPLRLGRPPRAGSRRRAGGAPRTSGDRRAGGRARSRGRRSRRGRRSPASSPPTRASSSWTSPDSTSSSGSRTRRCRSSSRRATTPGSHASGSALGDGVAKLPLPLRGVAHGPRSELIHHRRLAGQTRVRDGRRFPSRSISARGRPTRRSSARRAHAWRVDSRDADAAGRACSPCSAASMRRGRSRFRPPSARATSGQRTRARITLAELADARRRLRGGGRPPAAGCAAR